MADTRNYSRHYRQRLRAEVLLDAVSDVTEVPEKFAASRRSRARRSGRIASPRSSSTPSAGRTRTRIRRTSAPSDTSVVQACT